MKDFFLKILKDYQFDSPGDLYYSLFPSFKYQLSMSITTLSVFATVVEMIFGLNWLALIGFVLIMVVELASGIKASRVRKEEFQSSKLKRFSFRLFYYAVLIAVPYLLASSYRSREMSLAAGAFEWLHVFLVAQIVFENVVSILENISVIDGKDKTHIINKLRAKIDSLL